jgi:hypothetical protein
MGEKLDRFLYRYLILFIVGFYLLFTRYIGPLVIWFVFTKRSEDSSNVWRPEELISLKLLITRTRQPQSPSDYKLIRTIHNVTYRPRSLIGDTVLQANYTVKLGPSVKRNETQLYFQLTVSPTRCDRGDGRLVDDPTCHPVSAFIPIIRWAPRQSDLRRHLLTDKSVPAPSGPPEFEPYVYQNMSVDLVFDPDVENRRALEAHNGPFFQFDLTGRLYLPPLVHDRFWEIKAHRTILNFAANDTLDLRVSAMLRRKWIWNLKLDSDYGQDENAYVLRHWEDMKRAMADTAPVLLGITIAVSIAHVLLNLLAFKEDISWWNSRDTMTAISMQTVFIKAVSQFVVFLFFMDEEAASVVRLMHGLAVLLEFWKILKLLEPIMTFPYFQIKSSYRSTQEFDTEGSKYLAVAMCPILVGYAGWCLVYKKFKSVYSFVLNVAVGAVYAFGFLAMLPQLYVNYKLKTVAGMSGIVLPYKAVNTFVDDLFAFVMTMPTLHRIACFRDDIVFFVWLYQRHIYPTDPTRVNEFGEALQEVKKEEEKEAEGSQPSEREGDAAGEKEADKKPGKVKQD